MSSSAATSLRGAEWITTPDAAPPAGERPAYEFRLAFQVEASPNSAVLHATAHGIYEAFINGIRVGDDELTPGLSSYRHTLYVQRYDVGPMLRPGENELRLVVSDGWFRGRCGYYRVADNFGTEIGVVASLEANGTVIAATGPHWQVATGSIVSADLMDGQGVDLRRIGQESWAPAVRTADPLTRNHERLSFSPAPPVRRVASYAPSSITRLASGRQIVDFGQTISGWVRLGQLGPAGTELVLTSDPSWSV